MPSDASITRLLYAILSQKCLKDIDWNQVAQDPVLLKEISNGHAARMRYARFKKTMDSATLSVSPGDVSSSGSDRGPRPRDNGSRRIKKLAQNTSPGRSRGDSRQAHGPNTGMQRPVKREPAFRLPSAARPPVGRSTSYILSEPAYQTINSGQAPSPVPSPASNPTRSINSVKHQHLHRYNDPASSNSDHLTGMAMGQASTSHSFSGPSLTRQTPISASTPVFTYPSPGPTSAPHQPVIDPQLDETIGIGMGSYSMSPFSINMQSYANSMNPSLGGSLSMDARRERSSSSVRERERSMTIQPGSGVERILGGRYAFEVNYAPSRNTWSEDREGTHISFGSAGNRERTVDQPVVVIRESRREHEDADVAIKNEGRWEAV